MPGSPTQLTEFIPLPTLQRLVDSFAVVTGHAVCITDEHGAQLVESRHTAPPGPPAVTGDDGLARHTRHRPPSVTLSVGGHSLGELALCGSHEPAAAAAERSAVSVAEASTVVGAPADEGARHAEIVRFLYLLGDTISQVCRQGLELRGRVEELSTLFHLSTLLAQQRELAGVLDTVVRALVSVMGVKAAAIRLLNDATAELTIAAVHNLSSRYLHKGPILVSRSELDRRALSGEVVYIRDMGNDPSVMYPEDAAAEGIASILAAGMIYRGKPIGVMRIYTSQPHEFTDNERNLLRAIAQLAAAAVRNAQLDARRQEAERIERQVQLAADVQRRLLPRTNPTFGPFQIAGRYEPCFELGGDFYDFIPFEGAMGLLVGDVVGKGVAAGLLMASVRASFRAHVQDLYDIDEIMALVNRALCRDTRDNEFATVFYGTLQAETRRLTYSAAGHEPGLLWRRGRFIDLDVGGMALGIDADQHYRKALLDLEPGDVILLYSDGLTDAANFERERFRRDRVREALATAAEREMTATGVVDHVLWEVRRFAGLNRLPDDITIVAVRVLDA